MIGLVKGSDSIWRRSWIRRREIMSSTMLFLSIYYWHWDKKNSKIQKYLQNQIQLQKISKFRFPPSASILSIWFDNLSLSSQPLFPLHHRILPLHYLLIGLLNKLNLLAVIFIHFYLSLFLFLAVALHFSHCLVLLGPALDLYDCEIATDSCFDY